MRDREPRLTRWVAWHVTRHRAAGGGAAVFGLLCAGAAMREGPADGLWLSAQGRQPGVPVRHAAYARGQHHRRARGLSPLPSALSPLPSPPTLSDHTVATALCPLWQSHHGPNVRVVHVERLASLIRPTASLIVPRRFHSRAQMFHIVEMNLKRPFLRESWRWELLVGGRGSWSRAIWSSMRASTIAPPQKGNYTTWCMVRASSSYDRCRETLTQK